MKPRYVITAVAFVPLLVAAVLLYGVADGPTSKTRGEVLAVQSLRAMPDQFLNIVPDGDPAIDAGELYEQAIQLCIKHEGVLERTREHDELVDQLCELLMQAMHGRVQIGFLDGHIPVAFGAQPDYGPALENLYTWVLERAAKDYTVDTSMESSMPAWSIFIFGQRLFEHGDRLYHRNTGLDMMESAGRLLYDMQLGYAETGLSVGSDAVKLRAWAERIDAIRRAWQPKLMIVKGTDPHPGDLVNIALNDEDPMFRFEATLVLGIHRYGAERGNRRAMNRAIQAAIASEDPLLAEAGRAADALTLEQKRRLY